MAPRFELGVATPCDGGGDAHVPIAFLLLARVDDHDLASLDCACLLEHPIVVALACLGAGATSGVELRQIRARDSDTIRELHDFPFHEIGKLRLTFRVNGRQSS